MRTFAVDTETWRKAKQIAIDTGESLRDLLKRLIDVEYEKRKDEREKS